MAENSETATSSSETKDESQNIALLPRSAWQSQVTYLKVLLKAKQSLDKSEKLNREIREFKV